MMEVTVLDTRHLDGTEQGFNRMWASCEKLLVDGVKSWGDVAPALANLRTRYPASRYDFDDIKINDE